VHRIASLQLPADLVFAVELELQPIALGFLHLDAPRVVDEPGQVHRDVARFLVIGQGRRWQEKTNAQDPERSHNPPLGYIARMDKGAMYLGARLTLEDLEQVGRFGRVVGFDPAARKAVEACRAVVEDILAKGDKAPNVYGVNTGFGALAETRI